MSEFDSTAVEEVQHTKSGKKEKPKKTPKQEIIEWIVTIVAALAIAFVVRSFIFEPVRVDGGSMLETLQNGEVMFVSKYDYLFNDPERFDVVICNYPGRFDKFNRPTNFVKRVVGLPGDVISIQDGYLHVNGERYEESYIVHRPYVDMADFTVPENHYFVVGDNRSNSHDSRASDVGPITRDMIKGHVQSVVFPFNAWRGIE